MGYKVSSQPTEGLCVRAQTPTHCAADFKRCGLDSLIFKHKLSLIQSLTNTHTFAFKHTHAQMNHEYARSLFTHIYTLPHANTLSLSLTHTQSLDFLSSQTGTHRVLCARWLVWDGWREALLSTPVFAAVIRGTCYFGAAGVHALTHTHTQAVKNTESTLSGGGIQ